MRSFHWVLKTVAGLKTLGITIKIKGRLEFLVGSWKFYQILEDNIFWVMQSCNFMWTSPQYRHLLFGDNRIEKESSMLVGYGVTGPRSTQGHEKECVSPGYTNQDILIHATTRVKIRYTNIKKNKTRICETCYSIFFPLEHFQVIIFNICKDSHIFKNTWGVFFPFQIS